ncbi:MAG: ABC transporter permease [Methanomassiliicoccales archaeon]|nr:MAG: ABC transporter permease [Methanomassiliicoccales archaeon]
MKTITKSVTRKLRRMKGRTFTIVLVISLAMALFLGGLYSGDMMDASIETYFEDGRMPDLFMDMTTPVNESDVDSTIGGMEDVKAYQSRLKLMGVYDHNGEIIPALFYGVENPERKDINIIELVTGSFPQSTNEATAVRGMETKGVEADKLLHFQLMGMDMNLTISGIITGPEFVFSTAFGDYSIPAAGTLVIIVMPLNELQDITGMGSVVNEVTVLLSEGGDDEQVISSLSDVGVRSVTYQNDHPSRAFMRIGANKMKNMMPVMSIIFLLVGFISIFMTMIRLVQSDSRYIGVLMSLGYTKKEITRAYMFLGLVIGVMGVVLGVIFGLWFAAGILDFQIAFFGISYEVVYPMSIMPFALSIFTILVTVLVSTYVPIWFITRATVRDALEYKPRMGVRRTKRSVTRRSIITTMGLRNTVRNPRRTVITIIVIALTIGAAGSWLIMADSAYGYVMGQLESEKWDVRADFVSTMPTDSVNETFLGLDPGDTEWIAPYAYLKAEASFGGESKGTVIMASDDLTLIKDFDLQKGELDFDGGAVISNKLSLDLEADIGDTIRLTFGSDSVDLSVKGTINDMIIYSIYTSRERIAPLFPTNISAGAFIKFQNSDLVDEKVNDIRAMNTVGYVVVQNDIVTTYDELLVMAEGMLFFFFFLQLLITIAVAGSAVIISTMERDVEYATLDTLGISKWKTAKSILIEMGFLGILSAIVSIPFAYLFAEVLARVMEDVIFYFPIIFIVSSTFMILILGMMFVELSSFVPIRYARSIDTEKTIRERTAG